MFVSYQGVLLFEFHSVSLMCTQLFTHLRSIGDDTGEEEAIPGRRRRYRGGDDTGEEEAIPGRLTGLLREGGDGCFHKHTSD